MNTERTKSIILDLAIKHKLSTEQVKLICRSPFDAVAEIMNNLEFAEDIEETQCNVNVMYFGKFFITKSTLNNKQRRFDNSKKHKDAKRLHKKDEANKECQDGSID